MENINIFINIKNKIYISIYIMKLKKLINNLNNLIKIIITKSIILLTSLTKRLSYD